MKKFLYIMSILLMFMGFSMIASAKNAIFVTEKVIPPIDKMDILSLGAFEVYHVSGQEASLMAERFGGTAIVDRTNRMVALLSPSVELSKVEYLGEFEVKVVKGTSAAKMMEIYKHTLVIDFDSKIIYLLEIPKET